MADSQSRRVILEAARNVFSSDDPTHGWEHALNVERLTLEIAQEPEYIGTSLDLDVLSAAALLHDSGHTHVSPSWSPDRVEHVQESVRIARETLASIEPFRSNHDRLRQVGYLILHHDDSNYSFPIKTRSGEPAISVLKKEQMTWTYILPNEQKDVSNMLAILQEADAHTATGTEGAKRTLDYSISRGVPLFAPGNPLNAWMWEESAIGNVRLAAKRALLDSFTKRGKERAWQGYLESERIIKAKTDENGVVYETEVHLPYLRDLARSLSENEFQINRVYGWDQLVDILRHIQLQGNTTIYPYEEATIESMIVEIDRLSPLAYYALRPQIETGDKLHQYFLTRYALDPFDLAGIVELTRGAERHRIAPPIIERYTETRGPLAGQEVWALVDGLHRCLNAKRCGLSRIRAVVISRIPEHLPLVPLPLEWKDVRFYDQVPTDVEKRSYRFPDCQSFPDISKFSSVIPIVDKNCRYFFFRDLRPLGSSGIRKANSD